MLRLVDFQVTCLICKTTYNTIKYEYSPFVGMDEEKYTINGEPVKVVSSEKNWYFGGVNFICTNCAATEEEAKELLEIGKSYNVL